MNASDIERIILNVLDEKKAQDIVSIDLRGKSDFSDIMIIASGTSQRHVSTLGDYVQIALKEAGVEDIAVEGKEQSDWLLVDAMSVIVHLFHPEARELYHLEKMWQIPALVEKTDSAPVTA